MSELEITDPRFKEIQDRLSKMHERAEEFCQSRSNFQIEKFLALDNGYTLCATYKHVAHNSYCTMQEIRRMVIEKERTEREIKNKQKAIKLQVKVEKLYEGIEDTLEVPKNINPHFQNYDLDIFEASRQLENTEIRIKGLLKEVDYMESICDELVKQNMGPFTDEQFQREEPMYWNNRLINQMHNTQLGSQLSIGEGNYSSYLMASQDTILPDSNNQIEPINILDANTVASYALGSRTGTEKVLQQLVPNNKTIE